MIKISNIGQFCRTQIRQKFSIAADERRTFISVRGFTLLELMVSLGLFIIVVTLAVGGFVGALRSQRQVAALISANNNVSLALEQMAREIRTGRNFCDPRPAIMTTCPAHVLVFYNAEGDRITYRKDINGGAFIERGDFNGASTVFKRITGVGAFVWSLDFFVSGDINNDPGNVWPARVTIVIGVSAKEPAISGGVIRLQTTISSRQADE